MPSLLDRFLSWFLKENEPKVVKKKRYESIYPDPWQEYLFDSQPEATIRDWARRLHLFRYLRAYGGMSNDPDILIVVFLYQNTAELLEFFKFAGIAFVQYTEEPPQGNYLIKGTQWIKQPGRCNIAGQQVYVHCGNGQIDIEMLGNNYEIHEADIVRAEIIEKLLKDTPLPRLEPPRDDKHCICPKYYPKYFQ